MIKNDRPHTGREALRWAVSFLMELGWDKEQARIEGELLLGKAWGLNRLQLLTGLDHGLGESQKQNYQQFLARRVANEPLQYILGEQEFMSLTFEVTPAVLIPRSDTEVLVEEALKILKGFSNPLVIDLGTGSGAIAVSLAYYLSCARVWAVDISPQALEVARRNAGRAGVSERVNFVWGDLFDPIPSERVYDMIVSNPPYISREEYGQLAPQVLQEPTLALWGGEDGLEYYRSIIAQSGQFLKKKGFLLLEIGWKQGPSVTSLLLEQGFQGVRIIKDWGGRDRVVLGHL